MTNLDNLVKEWQSLPPKKRHSFYTNNILPIVASLIHKQYTQYLIDNLCKPYTTLVTTLSYDINVFLLLLKSIIPLHCVVFYTPEKEHLIKKIFEMQHNLNVELHPVEIKAVEHSDNMEIIKSVIKNFNKKYPPVLCDITGGKKIISTQIGIIAHSLKIDIAYIDTKKGFLQWGIPYPGYELIYIQKPNNMFALLEAEPFNFIRIRFIKETNTIEYEAKINNTIYRFKSKKIPESNIHNLSQHINMYYDLINCSILHNENPYADIVKFGSTFKSLLVPNDLSSFLLKNHHLITHLIIDEELHAIPWEIIFHHFNVSFPLIRIPNRDFNINQSNEHHGNKIKRIAFIIGSGTNVPNFSTITTKVKATLMKIKDINLYTFDAIDSYALQTFFAQNNAKPFSLVIYYGHAQFGNTTDEIGLVCQNGSIFSINDCDVLFDAPPECLLINACHSARSKLFSKDSFAYATLKAGVETYIGTHFFLEFDRSMLFIKSFLHFLSQNKSYKEAFSLSLDVLKQHYGYQDISIYNYTYYGY